MRPIATDWLAWSIGLSVDLSWQTDRIVSPAKRLNRSRSRLGCGFRWTQATPYSRWGPYPPMRRGNFEGEGEGAAHCKIYGLGLSAASCAKNGWTDWDTVWSLDSGVPSEPCHRCGCTCATWLMICLWIGLLSAVLTRHATDTEISRSGGQSLQRISSPSHISLLAISRSTRNIKPNLPKSNQLFSGL